MNENRARTDKHIRKSALPVQHEHSQAIAIRRFSQAASPAAARSDLISKGLSYSKAVATDLERDHGREAGSRLQLAQRQLCSR